MISLEPFEQTVSRISNRFLVNDGSFLVGDGSEDSWQVAQGIVQDIGGTAINIGGTSASGEQVGWARSSMSAAWLEEYERQNYHVIDPFIAALLAGRPEVMTDCGVLGPQDAAFALNHGLKEYGYGSLFGTTAGSLTSGYRSLVVFCAQESLAQVDAAIGFDRLKIIHAIIAANVPPLPDTDGVGRVKVREELLTTKERDILCWLACGLRNDEIAFKAHIAEVTVRKHLISIRQKLQAATREQAIAIAVRDGWITL